jgi:ribosomal protein S18 acetylase RimI-like enzyme
LAEIQTATWQRTYRGQVADGFLDDEVPGILARHWAALPGEDWRVVVAEVGGAVRGFVALDLAHEGGPYIDNLHVAPGAQGQGLGVALLAAAAREALPKGRLWLTVMAGNAGARRFYARAGGAEGAEIEDALFGTPARAFPVRWQGAALRDLALRE